MRSFVVRFLAPMFFLLAFTVLSPASLASTIHGSVFDSSGAAISHARVELLDNGTTIAATATDANGQFQIGRKPGPMLSLRVTAKYFRTQEKALAETQADTDATVDFILALATFSDQVTVVATGLPTPLSQTSVAVTALDGQNLMGTQRIEERLRFVSGLQTNQVGQSGGSNHLFIRGGGGDANKVLLDGIPANDIGGLVEFANLGSSAVRNIEVLRGPNSVLYGADAMAGVVSVSTPRGAAPLPLLNYSAGGGNFASNFQDGTLSGKTQSFDYFADYTRFGTDNSIPDSAMHSGTLAGNFGFAITPNSSLRATVHHDQIASGQPNAVELYAVPSNAKLTNEDSYFGVTWEDRTTQKWNNLVRYGGVRLRSDYVDFAPVGAVQYRDPSQWWIYPPPTCTPGAANPDCVAYNTIGAPVTLKGANGYTVSGQAYYQTLYYTSYPNPDAASTDKDLVYWQSDYQVSSDLRVLAAFHYENERGYSDLTSDAIERHNYDYTVEAQGSVRDRLFYSLGAGVEKNGLFGLAVTPRASLAYQAGRGTKLRASFGKGIKEPAVFDQLGSLYNLLATSDVCGAASLSSCAYLIPEDRIAPVGPQRSRSFDGGVDQILMAGRARMSFSLFHNEFSNGVEYVPFAGLIQLGLPVEVATAAENAYEGAMVNSLAYFAQGAEAEMEAQLAHGWFARGGYTYTDAKVQHSFSSDNIGPSNNPSFPAIDIGVYSPLDGARPFRVAPHTGYFQAGYRHDKLLASMSGTLVSRRDDSDFLEYDANGGQTMLLPNRNLDGAYQKLDFAASYQAFSHAAFEGSFQNLLSGHYSEAFGYPALPFTFRLGMKFTLGGEDWSHK